MNSKVAAAVVGFIFAIGLGLSGMTQPEKVIGFLNLFGNWDPSLAFVMIGAIAVHASTYRLIRKKKTPWFSDRWHVPHRKDVTPALLIGSTIFGMGWGLGGYCPGPALTSLASMQSRPVVFVISMIGGMILFRVLNKRVNLKK